MLCFRWSGSGGRGLKSVGNMGLWAALACMLVLVAGCSSGPQRIPVPVAEPTVDPAGVENAVVTPSPTVNPTPVPTLDDDPIDSVTTVEAGSVVTDAAGNQIAVHAVRTLPPELLVRPEDQVRIGEAAAMDVSMCRSGALATADAASIEFAVVDADDAPLTSLDPLPGAIPLVAPGFDLPQPGACSRGWIAVHVASDTGDVGRYVIVVDGDGDDGTERHVYQWSELAEGDLDPAEQLFERGETVTFNKGPLVGTTVVFRGWAELIGAQSPAGTRQVGVLLEVCTATEDWPEFGLGVDGWNLITVADPSDRLGADPLAPLSGGCYEDWVEFAVPFGQRPTGFTASDGIDRVDGVAAWTLERAAIDAPVLAGDG